MNAPRCWHRWLVAHRLSVTHIALVLVVLLAVFLLSPNRQLEDSNYSML